MLIIIIGIGAGLAENYRVVETPVFREALTGETVALRYYDGLPDVPCLGLAEYYRLVLGADMPVEDRGDGIYAFTAADGTAALLDANAGTLTCADFTRFTNLMARVVPGMDNQYLDAPAFARPEGLSYADPKPVTLDFAKYHIPVHAREGDVDLPLFTLSDLFANLSYAYVSFNGENVYVNDDNRMDPAWRRDPGYADAIYSRPDRAPDAAAFAYDELCFAVDTFYGYPGRAPLNDALREKGLDRALQDYSDDSRRCRALLKSEKLGEYALGSRMLSALLDDGGHTGFDFAEWYADKPEFAAFAADYDAAAAGASPDRAARARMKQTDTSVKIMRQKRRKACGSGHYAEKGDTAVIWFDSFMYDFDGWLDFYENGGPRPANDPMAHVIDGLDRASRNPEIKYVVLDVSCNRGGSADMVAAVMSLIADVSSFSTENLLTGCVETQRYRVDRNFDGLFDDRDAAVRYDFRFGALTSRYSFSCGNLLPALMRDQGMAVLGETSGGGTCAVEKHAAPEGFVYQFSSAMGRLINARGETIDDGVPVDATLTDGKDYSAFYVLDRISEAMNAFYAGQSAS
ncbi:MAG: hypothetical protein IJH86_09695 [Clostridia bacterium]|nr:hypothetical protein [Clostridia bacterium]